MTAHSVIAVSQSNVIASEAKQPSSEGEAKQSL